MEVGSSKLEVLGFEGGVVCGRRETNRNGKTLPANPDPTNDQVISKMDAGKSI